MTLGNNGRLYLKPMVKKLYPDLSEKIINEVDYGTYYIGKFGFNVTNIDNGGKPIAVTWTGNMNKDCLNISPSSSENESYVMEVGSYKCGNQFLDSVRRYNSTYKDDDHAHLQIVKVAEGYKECKPVAIVTQKEPLMIMNRDRDYGDFGQLVTKDDNLLPKGYSRNYCMGFLDGNNNQLTVQIEKEI